MTRAPQKKIALRKPAKAPKIDPGHGGRQVKEWIGASADAAIPGNVQLRIWRRENGTCYLSGKKILPGDEFDYEDVIPVSQGGKRRESNIRLALKAPHKVKTAKELAIKAKTDRIAKKHLGIKQPKGEIKSASFAPAPEKQRSDRTGKIDKSALPPLQRGALSGCFKLKEV